MSEEVKQQNHARVTLPAESEITRKNIEIRLSVKDRFDEIVKEEEEGASFKSVSVLSLLRDSLTRLLTHWWLHQYDKGTFTVKFPEKDPHILVNEFGLMSVSLNLLGLGTGISSEEDKVRINLSLPQVLLDELDRIANLQDKALTVLMRESFHLELLLYKLKERGGHAYITLSSGTEVDIVKNFAINNPSPKYLLRLKGIPTSDRINEGEDGARR